MPSPILDVLPRPTRLLAATVLTLVCFVSMPSAAAQSVPRRNVAPPLPSSPQKLSVNDAWDTLVTDVTVSTRRVTGGGDPAGVAASPMSYRLERSRTAAAGWTTTLSIQSPGGRALLTPDGSIPTDASGEIARIEDDDDGTTPRFFDRRGRRVTPPSGTGLGGLLPADATAPAAVVTPSALRRPPSGASWVHALLATPLERDERRATLERSHGRAVGQVRGLDRYLSSEGDRVRELLVDPGSALPVEVNVTRAGTLVSQRTTSYVQDADGTLVKRRVRSERLLPGASGARAITEVEFTSVRLERRR